jgi:hypothetical protein
MLMEKLANAKTPEERAAIKQALNDSMNGTSSPTPAPAAETTDAPSETAQTEDGKKEETAEELKAKLARLEAEVGFRKIQSC